MSFQYNIYDIDIVLVQIVTTTTLKTFPLIRNNINVHMYQTYEIT